MSRRTPSVYSVRVWKGCYLLLLGLATLSAAEAHADEGESVLSLSASFAGFSVPDHNPVGGTLGVDYERGVTDVLWLRASGGGGAFSDSGSLAFASYAELGITYVLDVLRYVPYINLGIGGIYMHVDENGGKGGDANDGEFENAVQPLISIGGGIDMLTGPSRSYGLFTRFESFLGRSAFFTVGARVSWRWGFF